jgi:hypothetical protein
LDSFKKNNIWGTAFWKWDFRDADTPNFNLVQDGTVTPTKYYEILKNAIASEFGNNNTDTAN